MRIGPIVRCERDLRQAPGPLAGGPGATVNRLPMRPLSLAHLGPAASRRPGPDQEREPDPRPSRDGAQE